MRTYREKDLGGDGTVPRVSASPQEADSDEDAMFSSDKHASLQNADAVLTQVRGWINSVDLGDFMASIPVSMSVDVAEVHQAGQGVNMQLTPSAATSGVEVSLTWVGGPVQPAEPVMSVSLPVVDGVTEVDLSAEEVGAYRLRVTGDEIEEVTDLIVVAPA
jgi:hypothetical protein